MQATAPAERTLTLIDHVRLTRLLVDIESTDALAQAMRDLLDTSDLVAARAVPSTVVTMESQVLLRDAAGDAPPYELTLCYPGRSVPSSGCVSVLSPVGGALLGRRVGDTASWTGPAGHRGAARILAVLFQPEAHGENDP